MILTLIILQDTSVKSYIFLDSQTLSEYISTIVLDDNKKILVNEALELLISDGTLTSTSNFNTKSLEFVIINKLKKSMSGGL